MTRLLIRKAARHGARLLFLLALSASDILAQETPARTSSIASATRLDVFGGVTLLRMEPGPDLDRTGLAGWQASVSLFPFRGDGFASRFGVAAELAQARRTPSLPDVLVPDTDVRLTQNTFVIGPAIRVVRRERLTTNFRVLVGVARVTATFPDDRIQDGILPGQSPASIGVFAEETTAAVAIGSAWDIRLASRMALRVNPSVLITRFGGQTQTTQRIATGIVFRWPAGKGR
jgi:hypothetical protein